MRSPGRGRSASLCRSPSDEPDADHAQGSTGIHADRAAGVAAGLGMIRPPVVLGQPQGQPAYIFGSPTVEVEQNNLARPELMVRQLRSATHLSASASPT